MQVQFFTVPVGDEAGAQDELNRFLRSHRVVEVVHEFAADGSNSLWTFCVKYLEGKGGKGAARRSRRKRASTDYKKVLSDEAFAVFAKLRRARKAISDEEGIPAFVVCTDAQLAQLAQLEELTAEALITVSGFGEAKAERYGERLLAGLALGDGEEPPSGEEGSGSRGGAGTAEGEAGAGGEDETSG